MKTRQVHTLDGALSVTRYTDPSISAQVIMITIPGGGSVRMRPEEFEELVRAGAEINAAT